MALFKQIGTQYGIYASYWKITDIELNAYDGTAHVVVSGYYDQMARANGSTPMKVFEYDVPTEIVQQYFPLSIDIAQVYSFVKTLGDFVFAEDA